MQRDLFNDPLTETENSLPAESGGFLHKFQITLGMDQILLASISLIAYSCLIYGLGVWTGSRVSLKDLFNRPSHVTVPVPAPLTEAPKAAETVDPVKVSISAGTTENKADINAESSSPEKSSAIEVVNLTAASSVKGKFTIQVVAYKQLNEANRFSEKLSQKGLQSFVLTQKSYHNVCVANFLSKQTARQFLAQLKSQGWFPKDAYVRNIA